MWGAWSLLAAALVLAGAGLSDVARAQDNYEIQVYGSETVAPEVTMFELHSNYTIDGSTEQVGVVWPTEHAVHETLEITHGFTPWFETGFYVFSSYRAGGQGWDWVGDHIRPRVRAPESWAWPVGVSMSFEFGYNIPQVSPDIWTLEIRPIIDKQLGRWYFSVNPALERALVGPDVTQGLVFAPDATAGYDVTSFVNVAVEYYSRVGYSPAYVPVFTTAAAGVRRGQPELRAGVGIQLWVGRRIHAQHGPLDRQDDTRATCAMTSRNLACLNRQRATHASPLPVA